MLSVSQVVSDSLLPHGLQHPSLPRPSPSPWVSSKSCPLSRWCHPTSSSSVTPFSSCPQPFPASGSFPMSQLFSSGDQSIGASASVLPMNIQGWFPLGLTGWISLQSKGLSKVFSSATVGKPQFFSAQPSLWSNSHICTWLLEKPQLWLDGPLSAKWCLCFSCSLYSLGHEISYSREGREPYHFSSWHWVKQWIEQVKQVKWVCKSNSLLLVIVVECKLCGYMCMCVCV